MSYPEISVIIPTYNNGPEIERAVKSVLAQDAFTGKSETVEIIVVNDGSKGDHLAILERLDAGYANMLLLHHEKQAGPAAARNTGIRAAKGALISFLDADDEWPINKISILSHYLNDENVDIAGGKIQYVFADDLASSNSLQFEDEQQRLTHVHLGTLLLRKSIFDRGFYFDEGLTYSEDMDWWLRLRENNIGIIITEQTTLLYHVHGQNMTTKKTTKDLQLLNVLHKSLQRRRDGNIPQNVPQLKDFRAERADPLISVIVPVYNGINFIERALKSILAQTYTNWELYIIDDGSTDGSAEFALEIFPEANIIKQKNAGAAAARNTGIKACSGDLVAFLDQDDEWLPLKLQEQWALLKNNPYLAFATCNHLFKCEEGISLPDFFKKEAIQPHRSFVPGAVLVRRPALLAIGGFDEKLQVAEDLDIVRRLRNAGFNDANVDVLLLYKWYHGGNETTDKNKNVKGILAVLHKQMKTHE